jgi:hypothetical protein
VAHAKAPCKFAKPDSVLSIRPPPTFVALAA